MDALADSLADPSRPSFLFGVTPPREGTSAGKCREICSKFVARQRVLATDGFIVYDIQDESSRTDDPRPFAFRRLLDPSWYVLRACAATAAADRRAEKRRMRCAEVTDKERP